MTNILCQHCQQPLLVYDCPLCAPNGYLWCDDGFGGKRAVDCWECGGSAKKADCTNTACPGIRWYALSRADSETWRMVARSIERDEK